MRAISKERLDKLNLLIEEALFYKHTLDSSNLLVDILFIRHNSVDDLYTYDIQEEYDQEYCYDNYYCESCMVYNSEDCIHDNPLEYSEDEK